MNRIHNSRNLALCYPDKLKFMPLPAKSSTRILKCLAETFIQRKATYFKMETELIAYSVMETELIAYSVMETELIAYSVMETELIAYSVMEVGVDPLSLRRLKGLQICRFNRPITSRSMNMRAGPMITER